MTKGELWTIIATFSGGVATLAAVLLLIWWERYKERHSCPCLKVTGPDQSADCLRYVRAEFASTSGEREELWFRLAVSNSGPSAAKDVQIRLKAIKADGATEPESRSNLWFKPACLTATSINILPRGIPQHYDIAYARHMLQPNNGLFFHLVLITTEPRTWQEEKARIEADKPGRDCYLDVGVTYTAEIAVLSSNADAVIHRFTMRLDSLPVDRKGLQAGEATLKELLKIAPLPN